ncbi:cholinesterase [Umbelopsis sp. AD052]|nr:cholinesterase [Umbelopsis sp. AD052]
MAVGLANASPPTAATEKGIYAGEHLPTFNQDMFIGIRYAQVPTGSLRFRPPRPLTKSWSGQKTAVNYGNSCYSSEPNTDNAFLTQSEDCLTLNIVRPSGYEGKKLPVGVWIHGGGFTSGVSFRDVYNLSYPVQQSVAGGTPIVAVSINYRVGPLGFLVSEEVQKEGSLNNGLKDQVAALLWIKQNIEAFNGNSSQITIWGESAGAESVSMLMLAYGGKLESLFHRGIMQSGSATTQQYHPISYWQEKYAIITQLVGCDKQSDTLDCLRQVDINKLVFMVNVAHERIKRHFAPTIDGDFILDWPKNLLQNGKFMKIPIISGANMDEGTSFGPGRIFSTDEVKNWLNTAYAGLNSSSIQKILTLYPDDPTEGSPFGTGNLYSGLIFGNQFKRGSAISGDITLIGPRRLSCEVWDKADLDVYSYNWNQSDYGVPGFFGTTHFQEVIYVFDNPSTAFPQSSSFPMGPDPTGSKRRLGDLISRFFMAFIATGDPNNAKQNGTYPPWPKYSRENPMNYYFRENDIRIEIDDWRKEAISFLNYDVGHQLLT